MLPLDFTHLLLERISSGVQRRLEEHGFTKPVNQRFVENIHGADAVNNYVSALREVGTDMHREMMDATIGYRRQQYMLPTVQYYLKDTLGKAKLHFLCLHNLTDEFNALADEYGLKHKMHAYVHVNTNSSSDMTVVQNRYTEANAAWVEQVYAEDIKLFYEHCSS